MKKTYLIPQMRQESIALTQLIMSSGNNELSVELGLEGDIAESPVRLFDTPEEVMEQFNFESNIEKLLW